MEGACPGHGWRRRRAIRIWAAAVVAVFLAAGAAVLALQTRPAKIPVHLLPVGQDMDSATAIAVDGPDVWVANEKDRWGGSVTELNAGDGSWVATLTGGCYNFDGPRGIAVDGSHIWVANSGINQAGGSVTELDASNGGWIQTLSDGTWIQSLLRGCIPGVLASGRYHFTSPGLVATVGRHIWVFGRDGVRVLTDPAARPGRGQRQ
jgi:hypothetical protein